MRSKMDDVIVHADVPVAVVEWDGDDPPVLYVHATGFHKCIWRKVARLVGRHAFAMDLRGHGDSGKPPDDYSWHHFAEEALAVVDAIGAPPGGVDGVGHSAGGGALILAEIGRPGTFRRLALVEPIVFPAGQPMSGPDNPLVVAATKRRTVFPSPEAAAANYLSKPHLKHWDPEIMEDYVRHGMFRRPDGQWELKCPGWIESQVYAAEMQHGAWDRLGEVTCPVLVMGGAYVTFAVGGLIEEQAKRMPKGECASIDDAGHFAPQEKPEEVSRLISEFLERP